jgi:phospho-N-acetylmuramoyl-pentapeptide-transferase
MMYYLHQLSEHLFALNVFKYQTFRGVAAAVTAFLLCVLLGNRTIRWLVGLKFGQPVRTAEEVHRLAELHGDKKGTPTMGGILLIGAVVAAVLLWARPGNPAVLLVIGATVGFALLGFWDDFLKVSKKNSKGVSEKTKLVVQFLIAGGVTAFFLFNPAYEVQARALYVPFLKEPVVANLSWFTYCFYALVIVGASNAVNLTDGLDGLATGCSATAAFAYAILAYVAGNTRIASYLGVPYYPFAGELSVICMALVGASLGFLWFNCHPAKVFMGDTGSLAIGGLLGVVAICCKQELLLAVVGGVFVLEALSVLIQRTWFKITKLRYGEGRRVFLMSPLHHHFELMGMKENTVIVRFWIASIVFAFLALASLKLR